VFCGISEQEDHTRTLHHFLNTCWCAHLCDDVFDVFHSVAEQEVSRSCDITKFLPHGFNEGVYVMCVPHFDLFFA
jgi:hypothetical protein